MTSISVAAAVGNVLARKLAPAEALHFGCVHREQEQVGTMMFVCRFSEEAGLSQ